MKVNLGRLLMELGFVASGDVAGRLLNAGAVKVNDRIIKTPTVNVKVDDVISVGRDRQATVNQLVLDKPKVKADDV